MPAPDAQCAPDEVPAFEPPRPAVASDPGGRGRPWYRRSWRQFGALLVAGAIGGVLAGQVYLSFDDDRLRLPDRPAAASQTMPGVTTYPVVDRSAPVVVTGDSLTGELLSTEDLRGDVVVLNVWGSWCAPCREEAPVLAATSRRLADRGVSFLGINVRDNTAAALAFEKRFGIDYPSIADVDGQALLSLNQYVPANAVPVTLVLDRQGRVAARIIGVLTATSLADALDPVIDETGKD
jgi:thiol-disulfide isomerase/thioredoxin